MWHLASESAIWFGDRQSRHGGSWRRRLGDIRGGKNAVLFAVSIWSLTFLLCLRPARHFCFASHLSNWAISFFCATMICLDIAFISGDLPFFSCISAMFKAC